jgi:hypothetical protein
VSRMVCGSSVGVAEAVIVLVTNSETAWQTVHARSACPQRLITSAIRRCA